MIKTSNEKITKRKNGKWKSFNKHAVLIAEGNYVNHKKHGTWREYYDHTGTVMIEEDYVNGVQHGRFISYHPNGKIFSEGKFHKGMREGYFRAYDEDGKNIKNLLFINNNQIEDIEEHMHNANTSGEKAT
jgi:antitoxin component YwqK of YwqJK toxin-antitoxin module